MKKLILASLLLIVALGALVTADSRPELDKLRLQYVMMHDPKDGNVDYVTRHKVTPWAYIWMRGGGIPLDFRMITGYVNTGSSVGVDHVQKMEMFTPRGIQPFYTVETKFRLGTVHGKSTSFQIGHVDEHITLPPMGEASHFGNYRVKIYLDEKHVDDFYFPAIEK